MIISLVLILIHVAKNCAKNLLGSHNPNQLSNFIDNRQGESDHKVYFNRRSHRSVNVGCYNSAFREHFQVKVFSEGDRCNILSRMFHFTKETILIQGGHALIF